MKRAGWGGSRGGGESTKPKAAARVAPIFKGHSEFAARSHVLQQAHKLRASGVKRGGSFNQAPTTPTTPTTPSGHGPDWTQIIWGPILPIAGAPTGSFSGNNFNSQALAQYTDPTNTAPPVRTNGECIGTLNWTGNSFNAKVSGVMDAFGDANATYSLEIFVTRNDIEVIDMIFSVNPGINIPYSAPFFIRGGVNVVVQIFVNWLAVRPPPNGATAQELDNGTIVNI